LVNDNILVSAIVSVYNSSLYIKGCIEDLINQSLYQKGKLEILIVDSASEEEEYEIIKNYLSEKIIYIRLPYKTTVYGAWNEGIKKARGKFITNANTDDRHAPDAFLKMAQILESMPNIVLVYADVYVTTKQNETFEQSSKTERFYWYDWDRKTLLEKGCFIGPQPMWRACIHNEFGYFDDSLIVSGDAEFWLRISQGYDFFHIKEPLGLYLKSDTSVEHRNSLRRDFENIRIITIYREAYQNRMIIRVKPERRLMEFDNDLITCILIASDREKHQAMIEMVSAFTKGKFEIIHIESLGDGLNIGALLNQAIARAQGKYIAIIDENVIITDSTLDFLKLHLREEVYLSCPITQMKLDYSELPYNDLQGLREYAISFRERNLQRRIFTRQAFASCMLINVELFSKVGVFDERFMTLRGVIDDFSIRATLKDCKIVIGGDIFVHCSKKILMNQKDKELFNSKWGNIDAASHEGKILLSTDTSDKAWDLFLRGYVESSLNLLIDYLKFIDDEISIKRTLIKILFYTLKYEDVSKILINSDDEEIYFYKALALISNERFQDAIDISSKKITKKYLKDTITASIAIEKNQNDKAEELLIQIIEQEPYFALAYKKLGYLQYSEGKKKTALNNIERAFMIEPVNPSIASAYHFILSIEGLYRRGEKIFKETCMFYPNSKQILSYLIYYLLKENKPYEAMAEIEKMISKFNIDEETLTRALSIRKIIGAINKTDERPSLSICMIVKNEETNIINCINSVKVIADEIIVVDTGSSDRTKLLAEIFGAKFFDFKWNDDFSEARNYSISHAKGDWILVIDADEVISKLDYNQIRVLLKDKTKAYQIVTRNYTYDRSILGFIENDGFYPEEKGFGWFPTLKVRLFPKSDLIMFEGNVHEMVEESIKKAQLQIETAPFFIHHYGKIDIQKDRIKGEVYYDLGKKKLKNDPNNPKAIKELAIVSGALGFFDEAIELWNKYLSFKDNDMDALLNLSGLYAIKKDDENLLKISDKILSIEPNNNIALNNINRVRTK